MVSSQLVEKIEEYEGQHQMLKDISVSEDNIPQHAWDSLAAQTEQEKDDEAIITPEHLDPSENSPEFDVTGSIKQNQPFSVEYSNIYIPSSQYNSMVQTLNERQRLVHDFIVDWCWKVKMKQNPQPFHMFFKWRRWCWKISHINHCVPWNNSHIKRSRSRSFSDKCSSHSSNWNCGI